MMAILWLAPAAIACVWLAGFLFATDFSVPLRDVRTFHRALVIFPHADDEVVTCGGFLHRLATRGCAVTLVILTRGERGAPDATLDLSLKDIRAREAQTVARILKISRLIQQDFGDGELHTRKPQLAAFVETLIEDESPDLLVTYDLAGLYGHSDHVSCSEVVSDLCRRRFLTIPLWYVTLPRRLLERTTLPEPLAAASPAITEKRAYPTHRVFIGASVIPKIKSWYAYKSQRASFKEGVRKFLPIWFFLSMAPFEYFADAGAFQQNPDEVPARGGANKR